MEFNIEVEADSNQNLEPVSILTKSNIDSLGRSYGTGKRKTSIARVWIKKGAGKVVINKKDLTKYFSFAKYQVVVNQPFVTTDAVGKYDVFCTVLGGGISSQAEAIAHGISKALSVHNPEAYHRVLRSTGLLTRDDRIVERKKPGRKKARKRFQFSKR
ncbi:MAG: 30S ribosomal protein S9 [Rickettsiales bacterium]|jgi:small subunit ribosomal protein S9|nr:30S ribosomal protein S9 [Rickettsiales bacterium]